VTEAERIETFLPGFGGFHGTMWDNLFPLFREMCADRFAQDDGANGLDAANFSEILHEASDAQRFFTSLAGRFCRRYDAETSRWLGFEPAANRLGEKIENYVSRRCFDRAAMKFSISGSVDFAKSLAGVTSATSFVTP
jgi:hypothetical protein